MKKIKVALDLDNTINFLTLDYISYAKDKLGIAMTPETQNVHFKYYDLANYFPENYTQEMIRTVTNKIFNDYDFWFNMSIHAEAVSLVNSLMNNYNYELYFVTYPWEFNQNCIDGKVDWIHKHFSDIKDNQIVFQKDKWNGDYDFVIDDNVEILNNCFKKGMHVIKAFHYYNIKAKCHQSFRYLSQIEDYLEEFANGEV